MSAYSHTNLLISGKPGVGKTTLIKRISRALPPSLYQGFLTEEIRPGRERLGFSISDFHGRQYLFAHRDFATPQRVGKYGVDVGRLDEFIERLQKVHNTAPARLYLIDEIGKMESFSTKFRGWIEWVLNLPQLVIATISLANHPWIDSIRNRKDVQVYQLTPANRDELFRELLQRVRQILQLSE